MNLNFLQFLQDDKGDFSSIRAVMMAWAVGILLTWIYTSVKLMALQVIPESVVFIMGIIITGKAAEKKIGKKGDCDGPLDMDKKDSNTTA